LFTLKILITKERIIMSSRNQAGKFFAAAVLCSLFTTSPVWAANLTSNVTVEPTTNHSNPNDSYVSIIVEGTNVENLKGIDPADYPEMTVYVAGDKVLDVTGTNNGSLDYQVNGAYSKNFLYIKGAVTGTVTANENATMQGNEARINAAGINAIGGGHITADSVGNLTVTSMAKTEADNTSVMAKKDTAHTYGVRAMDYSKVTIGEIGNITATGTTQDPTTSGPVTGDTVYTSVEHILKSFGLNNDNSVLTTGNIGSLNVSAISPDVIGANTNENGNADTHLLINAEAYGVGNSYGGKTTTGNIGSITVNTTIGKNIAGDASASDVDVSTYVWGNAYGLYNNTTSASSSNLTVGNIGSMSVTATAGDAAGGSIKDSENGYIDERNNYIDSYINAYGLYNSGTGSILTVGDLLGVSVTASLGNVTAKQADAAIDAAATAYGMYAASGATNNVTGNVEITNISAVAGTMTDFNQESTPIIAQAYSLYAYNAGSTNNVGVNITDGYPKGNGKTVKLLGDVYADDSGINNLILDGSSSYLQGNILIGPSGGTNNVTVTNGATWKPVYDNRYGSFSTYPDFSSYYGPSYTVQDINPQVKLTLSNKGKIDLTWDNETRDPHANNNANKRTLTLDTLAGDGGVLVVNTNLANNVADEFIITDNAATNLGIDVNYDPALATSGLVVGNEITGSAKVLTVGSGTIPTVTGVADSYNTYEYTPTITATGENTWAVTKLTITNIVVPPTPEPTPTPTPTPSGKNTITSPSTPMREARHQRMAMHNLWVNGELNNMEKRMGDLRAVEPAEAGIWARYEHNKLEKGSDATLKYNYFQLGFDKDFKGATGTFYRGGAFSYAKGTGEYEVGNGDLKEGALTLYQTWVGKNGNYYDVVAKTGKLMNNYDAINTANKYSADYHSWAYSISGEVGKRIRYANGLYVEPQAEFTLGRINGADYTTSTGMDVSVDKQNIALARLGVAVGKEIKNVGSYYAKASYYHDFGGGINLTASDSTTNPFSYSENSAKNWCVFTLGGDVKTGKNCNIFGELSKFTGELSNKVQVNIGARWNF
jgi:outer membrane autotransporter protein